MARVYEDGVLKMTLETWKKTHKDFKGIHRGPDGKIAYRSALYFIEGKGTCLVTVEIVKELPLKV